MYTYILTHFNDPNLTQSYFEDELDPYDSTQGYLWQAWNESIASKERLVDWQYSL